MSDDLERRVEALEREVKAAKRDAAIALGEAWIGSFLLPALFDRLVTAGMYSASEVDKLYDTTQMLLERSRAAAHTLDTAAFDYALTRLEGMIRHNRQRLPSDPEAPAEGRL